MRIFPLLAETDRIRGVRIGKTIYPKKVSDDLRLLHATKLDSLHRWCSEQQEMKMLGAGYIKLQNLFVFSLLSILIQNLLF